MTAQSGDVLYSERTIGANTFSGLVTAQCIADLARPFLPTPEQFDETNSDFFFFGYEEVDGSWLVRRQSRQTGQSQDATLAGNPSLPTLAASFPIRETLVYT